MITRLYWISFLIILILPLTVPVFAGITYIPGMDRVSALQTLNLNPSLSVPTWELPGGLLLADRLSPPGASRFGPAFQPVYPESDWFILKNPSDTRAVISRRKTGYLILLILERSIFRMLISSLSRSLMKIYGYSPPRISIFNVFLRTHPLPDRTHMHRGTPGGYCRTPPRWRIGPVEHSSIPESG